MSVLKRCGYTLNRCGYTGKDVDILKKMWIYCNQVVKWRCGYTVREHKYMTSEDFRGFDTIYHINHTTIIFWLTIGISIFNDVISLQILDKWHFSNGRENVSSYTSSIPAYQSSVPEWLWLTKMLLCSVKYL